MTTLQFTGTLTVVTCWCGTRHAVPAELYDFQLRQHNDGRDVIAIYCPLGHEHAPAGLSEAEKLRDEAEKLRDRLEREQRRAQAERDLREDTERRLAAQKGQTTKARKRAAAGLCPCCNRSFVQLRRHMATKHPDYDPSKER